MNEKLNYLIEKAKLDEVDVNELTSDIKKIINEIGFYNYFHWETFRVEGLHRARKHNHLEGTLDEDGVLYPFTCECSFWNPPKVYVTAGRCNNAGESLLYCSTELKTALFEVKPKKGDFVSIAFFNRKHFHINNIQYSFSKVIPIGISYLSQIPQLKKLFKNFEDNRAENCKILDNFLDKIFYQDISPEKGNEYLYKLSTAVKNCMMINIQYRNNINKRMHGLLYSSMVRDKKGFNLVFIPDHARTIFDLVRVRTYEVLKATEERIIIKHRRTGFLSLQKKEHPLDYKRMEWVNDIMEKPEMIYNVNDDSEDNRF